MFIAGHLDSQDFKSLSTAHLFSVVISSMNLHTVVSSEESRVREPTLSRSVLLEIRKTRGLQMVLCKMPNVEANHFARTLLPQCRTLSFIGNFGASRELGQ